MQSNWKRLKESEIREYGGMLPARIVLEHNEADHSYRTFLETIARDGEAHFQHGQYFYHEDDALADFDKRLLRLCPGVEINPSPFQGKIIGR